MSRFQLRTGVRQRGLGLPAWRRAIGLTVLAAGTAFTLAAMISLGRPR